MQCDDKNNGCKQLHYKVTNSSKLSKCESLKNKKFSANSSERLINYLSNLNKEKIKALNSMKQKAENLIGNKPLCFKQDELKVITQENKITDLNKTMKPEKILDSSKTQQKEIKEYYIEY